MAFRTNKMPVLQTKSASGSIASFNTALAMPLASCTSLISGYQEGSGIPSPQNVRPLHAFSSASFGKCDNNTASLWSIDNSFNGDVEFNQIYNYTSGSTAGLGVIRTITNGLISFSGESTSAGNSVTFAWTDFTVTAGHKVIVLKDFTLPEGDFIFDQYNGYGNVDITNTIMNLSAIFMIPQLKVSGAGHDYTGISGHLSVIDLTVMFGSTIADYIYNLEQTTTGAGVAFFKALYPNDYYPYNAGTKQLVGDTLATFTFGQSIYQGYIDWERGVVTAKWGYIASYNGETLTGEWLCNKAPYEVGTTPPTGSQVAYELAIPIEIPLGGINLLTQEGQNNIWADTGDIDLTYKDLDIAKRGNFREVFKLPS